MIIHKLVCDTLKKTKKSEQVVVGGIKWGFQFSFKKNENNKSPQSNIMLKASSTKH